jgi:hypothetical protein
MFRVIFSLIIIGLFIQTTNKLSAEYLQLKHIGTYHTGIFNKSAAEISAFDPVSKKLFVVNALGSQIIVLDISNPQNPVFNSNLDISTWGPVANSIAVWNGVVAIAVEGAAKTNNGSVVFFTTSGNFIKSVTVGALPDMLAFTSDGKYVLTCNEAEPNDSYTIDPEGSVSVIDISNGINNATVQTADFKSYIGMENQLRSQGIRIYGPNANAAQDFEPEYLAFSQDNKTAFVTLQENNALAIVDIQSATVKSVKALGYKNHNIAGNELDASDKDNMINIKNWTVYGMYEPDGIASYQINGKTYLVTANEGDSRDYSGYSEEARVKDLNLDPNIFQNISDLRKDKNLGRLTVTKAIGDENKDGLYEKLYALGGRSFSIWDDNGNQVYDSGEEFETIMANINPQNFNSDHTANNFDNRSDNKGPEPEGVTIAKIENEVYAFIGFERIGGIITYNISNPAKPYFVSYSNNRNFSIPIPSNPSLSDLMNIGDLGPEGVLFISAKNSPNNHNLIVSSNEVSGSVSIYQVIVEPKVNLVDKTVCHNGIITLGNFNANIDNTVLNGSGDYSYHWSPANYLLNANTSDPTWTNTVLNGYFTLNVTDNITGLKAQGNISVKLLPEVNFNLPVLYKHTKNTELNLMDLVSNVSGKFPYTFKWYDNSYNMIIDPTTVIPQSGFNRYYLTVMDSNTCNSDMKRCIVYVNPLGKEANDEINIGENGTLILTSYPNPVINEVTLNINNNSDSESEVVISDILGNIIDKLNYHGTDVSTQINMEKYSRGTYLLQVKNAEDSVVRKIVKE